MFHSLSLLPLHPITSHIQLCSQHWLFGVDLQKWLPSWCSLSMVLDWQWCSVQHLLSEYLQTHSRWSWDTDHECCCRHKHWIHFRVGCTTPGLDCVWIVFLTWPQHHNYQGHLSLFMHCLWIVLQAPTPSWGTTLAPIFWLNLCSTRTRHKLSVREYRYFSHWSQVLLQAYCNRLWPQGHSIVNWKVHSQVELPAAAARQLAILHAMWSLICEHRKCWVTDWTAIYDDMVTMSEMMWFLIA